jgi:hypothetical protein
VIRCVFVTGACQHRRMELRIQALCVDSSDPAALATFWESALGWRRTHAEADEVVLEPPAGSRQDGVAPALVFLLVPERKIGKNRLHLDLRPQDQAAEVTRLEGLGARRVDVGQGSEVTFIVMVDPEGNEFCVLRAYTPDELTGSDGGAEATTGDPATAGADPAVAAAAGAATADAAAAAEGVARTL